MKKTQAAELFMALAQGRCPYTDRPLSRETIHRLTAIVRSTLGLALDAEAQRYAPVKGAGRKPPAAPVAAGRKLKVHVGDVKRHEEKLQILAALRQSGGNRDRAAKLLGIGRATLYRKLKLLALDKLA
jgi:transcriptional regulator of acetoin/glycerol metabolism